MALPPTIPTSFVPHSSSTPRRFRSDMTGAFRFFAYAILFISFLLAIGVFFYGSILSAEKSSKDKDLLAAEQAIDLKTVENFVRLGNRLSSSETLLSKHIAFSGFFSSLESIMPTTARFTNLHLFIDTKGVAKVDGTGVAKNFNALASVSQAFANDGRIKDAIFSNIRVNGNNNSVSFSLTATLDPSIIAFTP